MMYIVIYDKVTKEIYRIIEKTDKIVSIGYSDNCAQVLSPTPLTVGSVITTA